MSLLHKVRHKISFLVKHRRFNKKINLEKDEWFFVFAYGIGDLYLFLSLVEKFKEYNTVKRLSIGIVKKFQLDIVELFDTDFNKVVFVEKEELVFCSKNFFFSGKPIVLHPDYFLTNSVLSLIGYKKFNLNDIYKLMLNIPMGVDNTKPVVSGKFIESANKKFENLGINQSKSILIAPKANSFDDSLIPFSFWEILINQLVSQGYSIYLNGKSGNEAFTAFNVQFVEFSLLESIPFVELFSGFISVRSGFCDLISSCDGLKKVIIYPELEWYSGSLFTGSSLEAMGLSKVNLWELIFPTDNIQNFIETIISKFKQ